MLVQGAVGRYQLPAKPLLLKQWGRDRKTLFGCRMMAFMSEGTPGVQNQMLRMDGLVYSQNSLQSQSLPESSFSPQKSLLNRILEAVKSSGKGSNPLASLKRYTRDGVKTPFTVEDLSGSINQFGNPDGWGLAVYDKKGQPPEFLRKSNAAFADETMEDSVEAMLIRHPATVMAHIRLGSPQCKATGCENVHPFVHQQWSFMHNGFINGALSQPMQDKLKKTYIPLLGAQPEGNTDSEATFYTILGRMKQRYGNLDAEKIGYDNVMAAFADTLKEVIQHSPALSKTLTGNVLGVTGELEGAPSANIVMTNGDLTLAFRRGPKLYLGYQDMGNQQGELIVASEMFQPIVNGAGKIRWLDLPENHILMVYPDKETGKLHRSIHPLSTLTIEPAASASQ